MITLLSRGVIDDLLLWATLGRDERARHLPEGRDLKGAVDMSVLDGLSGAVAARGAARAFRCFLVGLTPVSMGVTSQPSDGVIDPLECAEWKPCLIINDQ